MKIKTRHLIWVAVLAVVLVGIYLAVLVTKPQVSTVSADDDPFKGSANAKVTIVEFSDYQCPYCALVEPTLKELLNTYGDSIRIVYRDFPVHSGAWKSAEAAECADEQGKFWEYHDTLFENQETQTVTDLKKYAADLNLNTNQFNSCLDSGKYAQEVKKDYNDGVKYGVSGTPTFFINDQMLGGAQPLSAFQSVIDQELAK